MEHCLKSLSEYIDGALDRARCAEVEAHLSACADCRAVHEELKVVSKMVANLPQKPLPIGFMQRLERKRAAQANAVPGQTHASAPARAWGFSPRMAAFAMASVAVTLFVYEKSKPLPAISGAASELEAARQAESATLDEAKREQVFKSAAEKRAQNRPAFGALRSMSSARSFAGDGGGSAAPVAAPPPAAPAAEAPAGDPISEEELQAVLDSAPRARSKGFARARGEPIGHLAAGGAGGGVVYQPSARSAVRGGSAPSISNEQIQQVLQKDREAMGIRKIVSPAGRRAQTMEQLAAAAAAEGDDAPLLLSKASPLLPGTKVGTLKSKEELAESRSANAYDANMSADKAKLVPSVEGAIAQSEKGARELWAAYQLRGRIPPVDWSKQQLAVVVSADPGRQPAIVEVSPFTSGVVVSYRETTKKPAEARPYDARAIPRSSAPVRFERVD